MNENSHQKYADFVGLFAVGTRARHGVTALRRYRYNISVRYLLGGEPKFSTIHHELVDQSQV